MTGLRQVLSMYEKRASPFFNDKCDLYTKVKEYGGLSYFRNHYEGGEEREREEEEVKRWW